MIHLALSYLDIKNEICNSLDASSNLPQLNLSLITEYDITLTFCKSSSFEPLSAGRVRMFFFCFDDSSGTWNGTDLNFFGSLILGTSFG